MPPKSRTFEADVEGHVDDFLIPRYTMNMPVRLIDTYTGVILEREEIVSLLKMRDEFRRRLEAVIGAVQQSAKLLDPDSPSQSPEIEQLRTFIAEYLAFAMFSHRWRGREPSLADVKNASRGIYSMRVPPPKDEASDLPLPIQKLQEFCCVAAKCGFRWAWSDTCCINKQDFADTSLSINSMFLWYSNSYLTIVYLDDVDDIEDGRVSTMDSDRWFEDSEIKAPFPLPQPPEPQPSADATAAKSEPPLSLHDRLQDTASPELRTMHPDTQVDRPYLKDHLDDNFPSMEASKARGQYWKLPAWVTRGWTLQEMAASKRLRFYSKNWTLLEEANDPDTDDAEAKISISSFKIRARLVDHRRNDIWSDALFNTTEVPREGLVDFKPGARDVRDRLRWAARRRTTLIEDKAYCLLGIFDVSLPAMYGEGPRAFFRLQEEIIKRTGDVTLFDWCGRRSSVNTFLAGSPDSFIEPSNVPRPLPDNSAGSTARMILNIFCAICGTSLVGVKTAIVEARDWVRNILNSPPSGHTIVNGELNISLFEYQVEHCTHLERSSSDDNYHHYSLEANGLFPTTVTLASHAPVLIRDPRQYYLCRPWSRHAQSVFRIVLELIEYVLKDAVSGVWNAITDELHPEHDQPQAEDGENDDDGESKLREEMQRKRDEVISFFKFKFPVYLVHLQEGRRVRVNTVKRVEVTWLKFDFSQPVMTRLVL